MIAPAGLMPKGKVPVAPGTSKRDKGARVVMTRVVARRLWSLRAAQGWRRRASHKSRRKAGPPETLVQHSPGGRICLLSEQLQAKSQKYYTDHRYAEFHNILLCLRCKERGKFADSTSPLVSCKRSEIAMPRWHLS